MCAKKAEQGKFNKYLWDCHRFAKRKKNCTEKKRNREKRDKNETKNILENPVLAIAFFWQGSSKMYFSIKETKSVLSNMNLLPSSNKESKAITLRSKDKDFSFRTSYGSGEFVLYCQRKRDVHEWWNLIERGYTKWRWPQVFNGGWSSFNLHQFPKK